MKILRVFDTVQDAKLGFHKLCELLVKDFKKIEYRPYYPYSIKHKDTYYYFMANRAEDMLGCRFDKIEDCTTTGINKDVKTCLWRTSK